MFKLPCIPLPECKEWKNIEYASEEVLDRAVDHDLVLQDGWISQQIEPFTIKGPNEKSPWLNYHYKLKKITPK